MLTPWYAPLAVASYFNDDVWLFHATGPFELDRSCYVGREGAGNAHTAQF